MSLQTALATVLGAVGDGKLIPQHAYVLHQFGRLQATDGRQWASTALLGTTTFCVRADALKMALEREEPVWEGDRANGLVVRAGRSRTRIRGIDPNTWPLCDINMADRQVGFDMTPEIHEAVKAFLPWTGKADNHIWQNAVHLAPGWGFAAHPFGLICRRWTSRAFDGTDDDHTLTLPAWAANYAAAQSMAISLTFCRNGLQLVWEGGDILTSRLLVEDAPGGVMRIVRSLDSESEYRILVPEGLKEAVALLKTYGAKHFTLGDNKVSYTSDTGEVEIVDEVDFSGTTRSWSVDLFVQALQYADELDFSPGDRCIWHGGGYHGVFMGRQ